MDADIAAAFASISAQITELKTEIQGLKGGSGGNAGHGGSGTAHAPPGVFKDGTDNDWSLLTTLDTATNKRYFNADYWFLGFPGAQKGVDLSLWGAANLMLNMMGTGSKTMHFRIVTLMNPQPDGGHWLDTIKSPADIGWMDGSKFVVDMTASNGAAEAAWEQAGCPSQDADGYLINMGKYVTDQKGNKLKRSDVAAQFPVG